MLLSLCQVSPQTTAAGRPLAGGPPPMLKKLTGSGKSSAVGVQRRATISQADERLAEITNSTPTSQTPTQELKRYRISLRTVVTFLACTGLFQCLCSDVTLCWF